MPPKFREGSFCFGDDEIVPEHEDGFVLAEQRDRSKWWLKGHDTFEGSDYALAIDIDDAETAHRLATAAHQRIEEHQPTSSSGGQSMWGIQDRVEVMPPDGLPSAHHN